MPREAPGLARRPAEEGTRPTPQSPATPLPQHARARSRRKTRACPGIGSGQGSPIAPGLVRRNSRRPIGWPSCAQSRTGTDGYRRSSSVQFSRAWHNAASCPI
eukprot:5969075-Pyramimonas_sp.AAC.1